MKILTTIRNGKTQRFLLRGDSEGYVTLWIVPDVTIEDVKQIQDKNAIKCIFYFILNIISILICLTLPSNFFFDLIISFNTDNLYKLK